LKKIDAVTVNATQMADRDKPIASLAELAADRLARSGKPGRESWCQPGWSWRDHVKRLFFDLEPRARAVRAAGLNTKKWTGVFLQLTHRACSRVRATESSHHPGQTVSPDAASSARPDPAG
jgi:hypothetical protein